MFELKNKVVLITGGNAGIGKACAIAFAKQGANIVIAVRRENESIKVINEIEQLGVKALFVKTDVAKENDVESLINQAIKHFGCLDVAINNAGISGKAWTPLAEYTGDDWDAVMNINLKGVWLCMKYEMLAMQKQGYGAIVNMSSIAGLKAGKVGALYSPSKHGVIGLTKVAAVENAKNNIRVNAVCPTFTDTEMIDDEMRAIAKANIPMGRCVSTEEVAQAALWLCSDKASFVSGHSLLLDGASMA